MLSTPCWLTSTVHQCSLCTVCIMKWSFFLSNHFHITTVRHVPTVDTNVLSSWLSSSHVTYGLPFVILCLDSYKRGWEGKGTASRHTSVWPSLWWEYSLPCLVYPPSDWLQHISGLYGRGTTYMQCDRWPCVRCISCLPFITRSQTRHKG